MKAWSNINLVSLALWPLSLLFCALVVLRRALYRGGFLRSWRAPVPVIIVGNISVGGTGKTPVVIALVEFLQAAGLRPGVVSRGYGGQKKQSPMVVDEDSGADEVGDEPLLIRRRTGCPVCVSADRSAAARHLLGADFRCNVLVTDDGLQHYRLQRDFEIIVIDETAMHGNGFCLPAGPLREPASRLESADFVLFNRRVKLDDGTSFALEPEALHSLCGEASKDPAAFRNQKVSAVAGTASPERFYHTLSVLGMMPQKLTFPDHHWFRVEDFKMTAGLPIVMTEKDAVKCAGFGLENAWYLSVRATLPEDLQGKILDTLASKAKTHECR